MSRGLILALSAIIGFMLTITMTLGMILGELRSMNASSQPVCYASTEDSTIVGCDYRNGGWFPSP